MIPVVVARGLFAGCLGAALVSSCGFAQEGLGPAGDPDSGRSDGADALGEGSSSGSVPEGAGFADGSGDTVAPTDDANEASSGAGEASSDDTGAGPDVVSEAARDAAQDVREGGPPDVGPDAPSCVLPSGATLCCGTMSCTDHGASCSEPGICAQCLSKCTDPLRPICCALPGEVTCEVRPRDC
jgi:hypothetical protein